MNSLLAIGTDAEWLQRVREAAVAERWDVFEFRCVGDALEAAGTDCFGLVVVDADSCTERTAPALRALRARLRVRFLVAFGPASAHVARTLPADALLPKHGDAAELRRCLSSA